MKTLQENLDKYLDHYNHERTHQGKRCQGRTPTETFNEGKEVYADKNVSERMAA